jgi:hypothetical protein
VNDDVIEIARGAPNIKSNPSRHRTALAEYPLRNYITRRRTAVTVIAAAVLGFFSIRTARTAQQAGTVVGFSGQCFAEAGGQRRALRIGDPIYVGDTVDVPAGAKLQLQMADGSVISLASGSRMTIDNLQVDTQQRNARLTLPIGLLRAVVSPVGQPSIFEVDCAAGKAAVRLTDWFMEVQPGSARVGVLEGSVVLTSLATGRSVTIPARWGALLEAGRDPVPPRVWSATEFADVIARTDVR